MATTATACPHIVGIRHLSPAGARCIRAVLDEVEPELVLIEGLADATALIDDITAGSSQPPLAVLAYTADLPVRTIVSPLASYSPEYQALLWCRQHQREARFIDLPSEHFLAIDVHRAPDTYGADDDARTDDETDEDTTDDDIQPPPSPYQLIARQAGETDHEAYWERRFEHLSDPLAYRRAAAEFGVGLRSIDDERGLRLAETLVREAYMRRFIRQAIDEGVPPAKIVVLCGAYHASALGDDLPAMTDAELASLPRRSSKLTLMPYSYFKLSSQSGYGAGNHAPAYFELVWQLRDDPNRLAAEYFTQVARSMRQQGTQRSVASVIEATRLAVTLAGLHDAHPSLPDLHDAARTLLGLGETGPVAEALARTDIGTAIGTLADGVSQTAIQDDFARQLHELKLADYRTAVAKDLQLDLRENRRAKTTAAAFRDLHRSAFLHRLLALGVPFVKLARRGASSHTWAEHWVLQWTPEAEIALVEAVLLGETIEVATAYALRQRLDDASSAAATATIVRQAGECDLPSVNRLAVDRLRDLATEQGTVGDLAEALSELHLVRRYGDVRRLDPATLEPLITQLFLQAALHLPEAAKCDEPAARELLTAISQIDQVGEACHDLVDTDLWLRQLHRLSEADDRSPLLSGFACAILCERGEIDDEDLAREVSRRLSPGIAADLGAGWFEGLARRNRYALLTRLSLWRQLAAYIADLDAEQFRRALVFLRRSFGDFSPHEKRSIAENLGEIWGCGRQQTSESLHEELSDEEKEQLDDLQEFDFDDL